MTTGQIKEVKGNRVIKATLLKSGQRHWVVCNEGKKKEIKIHWFEIMGR